MLCSTGCSHTITLSDNDAVFSFGHNTFGQLGLGYTNLNSVPVPTLIPHLTSIKLISCASYFTVCVDIEGMIWLFGRIGVPNNRQCVDTPQKMEDVPPIQSISCGETHVLLIADDEFLWSFGTNHKGELCLENEELEFTVSPLQTKFSQISKIAAGAFHSLFQNNKGEVFGCGYNVSGQLGFGEQYQIKVILIPNQPPNIIQFSCGKSHSLFLDDEGSVYYVGSCSSNSCHKIQKIAKIPPIKSISCTASSCHFLDFDGNVWGLGCNTKGQLGNGDMRECIVPTKVKGLKYIIQISGGPCSLHFLVKNSKNKIFAMGANSSNQLGLVNKKNTFYQIPTQLNSKYSSIWGTLREPNTRVKSARK